MDIEENVTINLSTNDIKVILVDYLRSRGYSATHADIRFNIGRELVGYGSGKHVRPVFKGATISCKEKGCEDRWKN